MKVKFCGLQNPAEIRLAAELGCHSVGFVLVPGSRREVSIEQTRSLIHCARKEQLKTVALVADADKQYITKLITICEPDVIQFHGQESPEFCEQFKHPFWKAIPMLTEQNWSAYLKAYSNAEYLLLDAFGGEQSGGSGNVFNWFKFPKAERHRLILAGGLTVDNVSQAIKQTGTEFIDVSSGIEDKPGVKSPFLMKQFIQAIG